jgi:NADH-quinone oxidoreductase subunit A
MTPLAAYLVLFLAVGIGFIFVHLLAGKLIRPSKPDAEKGTVYECGEPTIGSAWVQFDVRFYVVALLFVIFDVEVAFFFPWAEVFGKANAVATTEMPKSAEQYREYAGKVLDLAAPASSTSQQGRDVARYQAIAGRTADGKPLLDAAGKPIEGLTEEGLAARRAEFEALLEKFRSGQKVTGPEGVLLVQQGVISREEFNKRKEDASQLAWFALGEMVVFFGVLLVGFAYLWRRGDLQWVRSTAAERPESLPPASPPQTTISAPAAPEPVGAAGPH